MRKTRRLIWENGSIANSSSEVVVLQITDSHLLRTATSEMLGVKTQSSLKAVLEHAAGVEPDIVIATGDIAQYPSFEVYQRFKQLLAEAFDCPLLCIPGNHDLDQPMLRAGLVARNATMENWALLGIDTHIDDEVSGFFCEERLVDLKRQLGEESAANILVFGHHPPVDVGCKWLDRHRIDNGASLLEILQKDVRVRGYVFGHVHQQAEFFEGLSLLCSPSTCFQFARREENFTVSSELPGYRVLRLQPDGQIQSKVFRLLDYELSLDLSQLQS